MGSGEGAHLFRRLGARTLEIMSSSCRGSGPCQPTRCSGRPPISAAVVALIFSLHTRSDRYLHTATCMERVQVAVPTSGEHALEVWEAIGAKALWRARGEVYYEEPDGTLDKRPGTHANSGFMRPSGRVVVCTAERAPHLATALTPSQHRLAPRDAVNDGVRLTRHDGSCEERLCWRE